ncbi:hypothetical protein HYH02_009179 [Chlamydomonas schloesseri]|uniref:Uncharacterized protein n=1 Tax=Chlamydomonas schloesseri TaxID=2026947 RepID=A0A836B0U1_9CHLO|nr:hypothetical protein HYH02_009179 [Chlamydomonas schloesseri]|eukprot:KAG2443979.1 hypothetical protein HYH02_009179 [Chlamydomonas schloesseri]
MKMARKKKRLIYNMAGRLFGLRFRDAIQGWVELLVQAGGGLLVDGGRTKQIPHQAKGQCGALRLIADLECRDVQPAAAPSSEMPSASAEWQPMPLTEVQDMGVLAELGEDPIDDEHRAMTGGGAPMGNSNGPKGEGSNPAMSAAMMGNSNGPKGKGSNPAQSAAMMGNSSAKGRGGGPGSRGGNSKRTERRKRDAAVVVAAVVANNKMIDAFFTKKAKTG